LLPQKNWIEILTLCKKNIKRAIFPFIKDFTIPQPDLGIGAGGDSIKSVDLAAEKAIIKTFQNNNIEFTLISEESGIKEVGDNFEQLYVTLDPIDGTTNCVHSIPFYCSSIALSSKPRLSSVSIAMVIDLFHDITYFAQKDYGAYCNNKRILPSSCNILEDALIGLDINKTNAESFFERIRPFLNKAKHIRHFGANALEVCYVAEGKTEAFIDIRGKLRTTDLAASYLILMESGGILTTLENDPLNAKLDPKTRVSFVASGNNEIHKKILASLRNH
jgi:myo-inositol-1(or 4)-monophosphatase